MTSENTPTARWGVFKDPTTGKWLAFHWQITSPISTFDTHAEAIKHATSTKIHHPQTGVEITFIDKLLTTSKGQHS